MLQFGYKSRVVDIGDIPLGGENPIRIQSMTSTNTMDTKATVEQSIRMIEAGCEYVRITAPGVKEAENLHVIKNELRKRGFNTPLIADIHYLPKAALIAARFVEKVRINPGNYVDRKRGKLSFSESEYNAEIDKIRERIKPLVEVCKQNGTAMRIGSNHGSLSERILLRYGDTPQGMVESALEFVHICEDFGYQDLVLSMKASNVKVMVQANRLLVHRMKELNIDYPIHLGVTEAGDAEDGRIKSAAGIGPLLIDGIGDTIRVSLTEDPEFEIPVALQLKKFETRRGTDVVTTSRPVSYDPTNYLRRKSGKVHHIGQDQPPVVVMNTSKDSGYTKGFEPDYLFIEDDNLLQNRVQQNVSVHPVVINSTLELKEAVQTVMQNSVLVFNLTENNKQEEVRTWFGYLSEKNVALPVILRKNYGTLPGNELLINASVDFSSFLVDGLLDGIWIQSDTVLSKELSELSFGILQASGSRISKTEYIACPSCGRTQFNIQNTLQVIKSKTSHLKGLKIGVMGCCVNGPGEMADADYGYVGAGKGKITLYRRQKIVKQGVQESVAVDELIRIIKTDGNWKKE